MRRRDKSRHAAMVLLSWRRFQPRTRIHTPWLRRRDRFSHITFIQSAREQDPPLRPPRLRPIEYVAAAAIHRRRRVEQKRLRRKPVQPFQPKFVADAKRLPDP